MTKKLWLNTGIILISLIAFLIVFLLIKDINLTKNGVKTEGIVSRIETTVHYNSRQPLPIYGHIPVIIFFDSKYIQHETRGCSECYKVGDKVKVIYDPQNPKNAETYPIRIYELIYYLIGSFVLIIIFIYFKRQR
jgi:hypothetical protein